MFKAKIIIEFISLLIVVLSQWVIIIATNPNIPSLYSLWNYITEHYKNGNFACHLDIYDQYNTAPSLTFYHNYYLKYNSDRVEYFFDKSTAFILPGTWNTPKENLLYFEFVKNTNNCLSVSM